MTSLLRRTALSVLAALAAGAVSASVGVGPASADSTEDFPIPRRIIGTRCDAEPYLAAARDTSPVYYERYMVDKSHRPADVQEAAVDRIHWFFSLDPARRRQYSEDTATNVYYEQVATHWGNLGEGLLQQQRRGRQSHRSLRGLSARRHVGMELGVTHVLQRPVTRRFEVSRRIVPTASIRPSPGSLRKNSRDVGQVEPNG